MEYSSPDPLRIEAISWPSAQAASNEWYRLSHSGLRIASSIASERHRSRRPVRVGSLRATS